MIPGSNSLLDQARGLGHLGQTGLPLGQLPPYQQFCATGQMPWELPRLMTPAGLGIVDQNLDDKVGMDL